MHIYAEGPDLLLSDLLIYLPFYIIFKTHPQLKELLPKTWIWFHEIMSPKVGVFADELLQTLRIQVNSFSLQFESTKTACL